MSPPINIDGSKLQDATIDGQDVREITIDGQQAAELILIPKTIDDFEDGNISEYGGDTGSFRVQSSTVIEGSRSLASSSNKGVITSTSGLPRYFPPGNTAQAKVRAGADEGRQQILFGVPFEAGKNNVDAYACNIRYQGDAISFLKFSGGSGTFLGSTSASLSANTTYTVEIEYGSGGNHTVSILNPDGGSKKSVSVSDSEYTSDGVGFTYADFGSGTAYFFDDYVTF